MSVLKGTPKIYQTFKRVYFFKAGEEDSGRDRTVHRHPAGGCRATSGKSHSNSGGIHLGRLHSEFIDGFFKESTSGRPMSWT